MAESQSLPVGLRLTRCTPVDEACGILCTRVLHTARAAPAHLQKGNEATAEGEAFATEDIQAILANRTEKRQIGSKAGNTFSTATFAVTESTVRAAVASALTVLLSGQPPLKRIAASGAAWSSTCELDRLLTCQCQPAAMA